MGPNQPVTGQGMAHPSVQSSQAHGCGCTMVPVPAGHWQHQCVTATFVLFSQERRLLLQSLPSYCSQTDRDNAGVLACTPLSPTP